MRLIPGEGHERCMFTRAHPMGDVGGGEFTTLPLLRVNPEFLFKNTSCLQFLTPGRVVQASTLARTRHRDVEMKVALARDTKSDGASKSTRHDRASANAQ